MMRRVRSIGLVVLVLVGGLRAAVAQELRVTQSLPAIGEVIDGTGVAVFVRFDRPVDHVRSLLAITRNGEVVETLRPRLKAAPNVLFGRTATLEPGSYVLRWAVRSPTGDDIGQGDIPFSVGR
jgi:methionine-rich copper-binding protein CopC